jgi:hypothetical protein
MHAFHGICSDAGSFPRHLFRRGIIPKVSVQMRDLTHGMLGKAGCFIHELLLARDVTRVQLSLLCSLDFLHVYIRNDV